MSATEGRGSSNEEEGSASTSVKHKATAVGQPFYRGLMSASGEKRHSGIYDFPMRTWRGPVLISLALTLTACPSNARFELKQESGRAVFEIEPADSPVCPDMLAINDGATMRPTWQISSTTTCARRFVYGVVPAGFQQQLAAVPLVKGREYVATASGVQPSTFTFR